MDTLRKRELWANEMRKSKRKEIINIKREKLYSKAGLTPLSEKSLLIQTCDEKPAQIEAKEHGATTNDGKLERIEEMMQQLMKDKNEDTRGRN